MLVSVDRKMGYVSGPFGIPIPAPDSSSRCNMIAWNPRSAGVINNLQVSCNINSVAFSPDDKVLATAGSIITIYKKK